MAREEGPPVSLEENQVPASEREINPIRSLIAQDKIVEIVSQLCEIDGVEVEIMFRFRVKKAAISPEPDLAPIRASISKVAGEMNVGLGRLQRRVYRAVREGEIERHGGGSQVEYDRVKLEQIAKEILDKRSSKTREPESTMLSTQEGQEKVVYFQETLDEERLSEVPTSKIIESEWASTQEIAAEFNIDLDELRKAASRAKREGLIEYTGWSRSLKWQRRELIKIAEKIAEGAEEKKPAVVPETPQLVEGAKENLGIQEISQDRPKAQAGALKKKLD